MDYTQSQDTQVYNVIMVRCTFIFQKQPEMEVYSQNIQWVMINAEPLIIVWLTYALFTIHNACNKKNCALHIDKMTSLVN